MDNFNEVVAVGGIVRIANGCRIVQGTVEEAKLGKKALPNIQVVEYLRAFLAGRVAWSQWNALLIISGAFGVFKKNPVIEMGGYSVDTVGEDMDLVIRLHQYLIDQRQKYHIVFIPDPICWTEAPSEWGVLAKQRNRWHRGLSQVLFAHIKMLFNPRYGRVGLLAMPYFFIVELLSPVIEVVGYLTFGLIAMIGTVQLEVAMAFFILAVLMGLLLSLLSILLEVLTFHRYPNVGTLIQLLFATVLENFGYRQVTSILRLQGLVDFLRKKHDWGVMTRKGF
jgi:cellulose synthase/poly-beta-1,6-N-acetylglucosamine synthase-like glycosyltransferase